MITRTSDQPRKAVKTRKCRICRQQYRPWRELQPTCGEPDCEHAYAMQVVAKRQAKQKADERKAIKARKEKIKTLAQLAKEAEQYVNKYVRLRDSRRGCISCDRPSSWGGQWHASHFKSVGSNSALRFHLWNIHKSCSICNAHLSGNIGEYTRRLPLRIGSDRFEFISSAPRDRKYTREYLIRLKQVAQKACKRLERRMTSL